MYPSAYYTLQSILVQTSFVSRRTAWPVIHVHPCFSHPLILFPRRLGVRVYNGMEELVDDLAARFVADGIDLLDLDVCVLLGILFSLLVA
jgi:hypothetical protein